MIYSQVLNGLRSHTKVVVCGPQRSGTTIATEMLAGDLGYESVLEEGFGIGSLYNFAVMIHEKNRMVIQAPAMSSYCHHFPVAVVFMRRRLEDILRSQDRIDWSNNEVWEKERYFRDDATPIAQVKYEVWEKYQKRHLGERAFDLDYDSLEGHPLWVESERRRSFGPRQTKE
jgi:hypothetical protein